MIGISTLIYDLDGHMVLNESPKSIIPNITRRVSRTATLDGKAIISDLGHSVSDGTYIIKTFNLSKSDRDKLKALVESYSLVRMSTRQGCLLGVIKSLNVEDNPMEFVFFVQEKVS